MLEGIFKSSKKMVVSGAILIVIAASFASIILATSPEGAFRLFGTDAVSRELENENEINRNICIM